MGWKELFMPDWRKVAVFLVLIALTYFYESSGVSLEATFDFHGLPLPYYQCVTSSLPGQHGAGVFTQTTCNFQVGPDAFPYLELVIDVIFWYLVSCLIIGIYDSPRKKKRGKRKKRRY